MSSSSESKSLEEKLSQIITRPPRNKKGIKHISRYVGSFPVEFIINVIGFNNYREHRIPGIFEFSSSMLEHGLLEPVSLEYNTITQKWDFIDGEGRVWGALFSDAETMPVEIYYNLPEEIKLRMKAVANAGKKEIDPADISVFSHGLYVQENFTTTEFGRLVGRAPSTARVYLKFAGMAPEIIRHVSEHRDEKLFSRALEIAEALTDHEEQRKIFFSIFDGRRVNPKDFRRNLQARMEELSGKEFELSVLSEEKKPGQSILNELFQKVRSARKYVDAFYLLLEHFPEIKPAIMRHKFGSADEGIEDFIQHLKEQFEASLSYSVESTVRLVRGYIENPQGRNFRDKASDKLNHRKIRGKKVKIHAIGKKVEYIPTDYIRDVEQHPRNYALGGKRSEPDEALDREIRAIGQIKPGLVEIIGNVGYRIVYGQRRFDSVKRAEIPFFKTFVVPELGKLQRGVLQCAENLFEADTAAERAKVLYTQYQLMKLISESKGEEYTIRDFVNDFGHLASDNTLARSIRFMEQDQIIQDLVRARVVSFGASFKISSVKEEKRLEVLYAAMVLSRKELEQRIKEINGNQEQMTLFKGDLPRSFTRIFQQMEQHSKSPFSYLLNVLSRREDVIKARISSNPYLFMHYAKLYTSICQLEEILS